MMVLSLAPYGTNINSRPGTFGYYLDVYSRSAIENKFSEIIRRCSDSEHLCRPGDSFVVGYMGRGASEFAQAVAIRVEDFAGKQRTFDTVTKYTVVHGGFVSENI